MDGGKAVPYPLFIPKKKRRMQVYTFIPCFKKMKISKDVWDFKEENFGPLLPYVKDSNITDINYNGSDVWVEDLSKGVYKTPVRIIGRVYKSVLRPHFKRCKPAI